MRILSTTLENRMIEFDHLKNALQQHQFTLGGNWEYDHGYYDRGLDEENKVWLRIPFAVTSGRLDGDNGSNPDTNIRVGTPFILKHVYNEGLDAEAEPHVYTAFFDQFQDPVDKDASVEAHWIEAGNAILKQIEGEFS